jgi:hypothetical protein
MTQLDALHSGRVAESGSVFHPYAMSFRISSCNSRNHRHFEPLSHFGETVILSTGLEQ